MTHGKKSKTVSPGLKSLVQEDRDLMKELVREALQSFLEAEMTEFLGASSGERTDERKGYRAGYYRRSWIVYSATRILNLPNFLTFSTGHLKVRTPRPPSPLFDFFWPFSLYSSFMVY